MAVLRTDSPLCADASFYSFFFSCDWMDCFRLVMFWRWSGHLFHELRFGFLGRFNVLKMDCDLWIGADVETRVHSYILPYSLFSCSQCWRNSLHMQIISEPRAPADLASWQGQNPQYLPPLYDCVSTSFAPEYGPIIPSVIDPLPFGHTSLFTSTPSPSHQISWVPLPMGTPSLHVSQSPSGGNPLRYLSTSTRRGSKS